MHRQIIEAPTVTAQRPWSAYRVLQLNYRELCSLFRTLDAPTVREMHGEYRLGELAQQSLLQRLVVLSFSIKSSQLCKAFEPTAPDRGHGYNGVVTDRGVERKMFFEVSIRPSRIDGRDSLHITYDHHNPDDRVLRSIVDELRKVDEGLYLGLGYAGKRGHERVLWPFMLEGPEAPFVPDIVR
jgi:hypothetical protein